MLTKFYEILCRGLLGVAQTNCLVLYSICVQNSKSKRADIPVMEFSRNMHNYTHCFLNNYKGLRKAI